MNTEITKLKCGQFKDEEVPLRTEGQTQICPGAQNEITRMRRQPRTASAKHSSTLFLADFLLDSNLSKMLCNTCLAVSIVITQSISQESKHMKSEVLKFYPLFICFLNRVVAV